MAAESDFSIQLEPLLPEEAAKLANLVELLGQPRHKDEARRDELIRRRVKEGHEWAARQSNQPPPGTADAP